MEPNKYDYMSTPATISVTVQVVSKEDRELDRLEKKRQAIEYFKKYGKVQFLNAQDKWTEISNPTWNNSIEYRAIPEKKYRPYTAEELIGLIGKHATYKANGIDYLIWSVSKSINSTFITFNCKTGFTRRPECLLAEFTIDGNPCGVEIG